MAPDIQTLPSRRQSNLWSVVAMVTVAPLLISLSVVMWRTPYPISETVSLLELAGVMGDARAPTETGIDPILRNIFSPSERSWYRPFYHLTWYALWHATGSLNATLRWFKALEVASAASLILLLLWRLRPTTLIEYAATTVAVSVLVGMPGFETNLEIPLLMTLVGMPLGLITWMILEHDRRAWHGPVVVLLAIIAVGYKEQGLVLVPLMVAAWWTGAPGATRATTATVTLMALAYLLFRFSAASAWSPFEQDVGLGFGSVSAHEASERFGAFPFWIYAYNAACTVANILFSEPSSGTFGIVRDILRGEWLPWEIIRLASSTALTGLVVWWGIRTWKREAGGAWSAETRVLAVVTVVIAASGALGFSYSRARLGGMAVPFYAIAAYFAVRAAAERAAQASRAPMAVMTVALLLLAGAWQIRAVGTLESMHLAGTKTYREWLTDLHLRRIEHADNGTYLKILTAMVPRRVPPAPTPLPPWIESWLGPQ